MTKNELIVQQAIELGELRRKHKDLKKRVREARVLIVGIGGPLNDNKLAYSKEQLVTFHRNLDQIG